METILHLTDIHFGWQGGSPSGQADREVCLRGLLNVVKELDPSWRPTVVCVTGDIGWCGSAADYKSAHEWLDQLLEVCKLTFVDLVVCAGNHDVIRDVARKLARPGSTRDADEVLEVPIASHFEEPFHDLISFCDSSGIPRLDFGTATHPLVGTRVIRNTRFVVLNTAWFSKDDDDQSKLWLGLPHLRYLEAQGELPIIDPQNAGQLTVALFHHPAEWLHRDEQHASAGRPNPVDYVAHRSHLILTGHTHGEVRRADRIADRALHFTGGSAYAGASHFNSFRLIQVTDTVVTDRAFEFDPRSAEQHWRPHPAESRPLTHATRTALTTTSTIANIQTDEFRVACRKDAARQLERKSRQLRQSGTLPAIIERPVAVRVSAQHSEYDAAGRLLRPEHSEQTMRFYDAARQARRTLLLGDLGSGKSTLAAQLVIETIDKTKTAVAVFIPAKGLPLSGQFSHRELLTAIDTYINGEVWLGALPFNIRTLLDGRVEILLVLDGLDELSRDVAARLLKQAAALADNWSTIQILSTARPIELVGVSYADWRILQTLRLDDSAKAEFIKNELAADGIPTAELREKTSALLRSLKEMAALDSIANSPLAIRLIYPRLQPGLARTPATLGDLLYGLLIERLDGWHRRDDKPEGYTLLNRIFPTPEQKAQFIAGLAEKAAAGIHMGYDEAKEQLRSASATLTRDSHELAAEALSFFEWLGLIEKAEFIEFPLQPLAEVCAAAGLADKWGHGDSVQPEGERWRIVSFAAAIARRRGLLAGLRAPILIFIERLLQDTQQVPAACYIVVEAADRDIAQKTIRLIDNVEYRPLTIFRDEPRASARNIAKTLVLAEHVGFEWFYTEYLDPRYPIPNAGAGIVTEVFAEWVALIYSELDDDKKRRLSKLVEPYKATEEGNFFGVLGILSLVVPEAFSRDERFWRLSRLLGSPLFGDLAKEQFEFAKADAEFAEYLNAVLLSRAGEMSAAARLWCEWNPSLPMPSTIVRQALHLVPRLLPDSSEAAFVDHCRQRLGQEIWLQFARWTLIADQTVAGAAKVLFNAGERRISVLGDAAMRALHDGAFVPGLEEVLSALVTENGTAGVRWLAHRVANSSEWHGAYSAWWRVLLANIEALDDGPALLASCAHCLGPFTIPRYPDVREGFGRVLAGSRAAEFRGALREKLKSYDPNARRGAATILVASDPKREAEALVVVARSRADRHDSDRHEWDAFCLTLSFSPSVLAFLHDKMDLLDPRGRAFALVLLKKNDVPMDATEKSELMTLLSTSANWLLCSEPTVKSLLGTETSFKRMVDALKHPGSEQTQTTAQRLLEFHVNRLAPIEEAKCLLLRHGKSWWTWELGTVFRRIARDSTFANNIIKAAEEMYGEQSPSNVLSLFARAINDSALWKEVLWVLFCDDARFGGSSESEQSGMALLEFGLEAKHHQKAIGEAAKAWLADPRVQRNRWHEAYHWLGLIADEFSKLPVQEIERIIIHGDPIGYSATTALIARLGKVPEGFSLRRTRGSQPPTFVSKNSEADDATNLIAKLKDFSRDSDEFHPALIATIERCVFIGPLDEATLSLMASIGRPGILISTALRFVYGQVPNFDETIPLLDRWAKIWSDAPRNKALEQLARIWRLLRESSLRYDVIAQQKYLAALDKEFLEGETWKLALSWDILEIRGSLLEEQVGTVFREYADHPSFLHEVIFVQLCRWLSDEISEPLRSTILLAAKEAIVIRNEAPWLPTTSVHMNVWADLLFPVVCWSYGTVSDGAEAVFLRGIRSIFDYLPHSNDEPRTNLSKIVALLDPLLAKCPAEVLRGVLQRGIDSLEPSISGFCRLIAAMGRTVEN